MSLAGIVLVLFLRISISHGSCYFLFARGFYWDGCWMIRFSPLRWARKERSWRAADSFPIWFYGGCSAQLGAQLAALAQRNETGGCIMSSLGAPGQRCQLPVSWNEDLAEF